MVDHERAQHGALRVVEAVLRCAGGNHVSQASRHRIEPVQRLGLERGDGRLVAVGTAERHPLRPADGQECFVGSIGRRPGREADHAGREGGWRHVLARRAGTVPLQAKVGVACSFEEGHQDRVCALRQVERGRLEAAAMDAAMIDDLLAIDPQGRAVVAGEMEAPGARLRDLDGSGESKGVRIMPRVVGQRDPIHRERAQHGGRRIGSRAVEGALEVLALQAVAGRHGRCIEAA